MLGILVHGKYPSLSLHLHLSPSLSLFISLSISISLSTNAPLPFMITAAASTADDKILFHRTAIITILRTNMALYLRYSMLLQPKQKSLLFLPFLMTTITNSPPLFFVELFMTIRCHRVSLAHSLYDLQESVGITYAVDDPTRARRGGWCFDKTGDRADPVYGEPDLLGVYNRLTEGGKYVGRATLPMMVDTKSNTIVCNESKDIVRMLRAMSTSRDLAPPSQITQIEALSGDIYTRLNNGVYRCGFSSKQAAYDIAVKDVFDCLDDINVILEKQSFLNGNTVSEADVFLLPTVTRFDAVYNPFFRASKTSISSSFPNIMRWLRDMYAIPNVRATFDLDDAKRSYYKQLFPLNPSAMIPATMEQPYLDTLATKEDTVYASTVFDSK